MAFKALDLAGQRFGMLIATNQLKTRQYPSRGQALRLCYCDCGNEAYVTTGRLRSGHTASCGCNKGTILAPGRAVRNQILDGYKRGAADRQLEWSLSDNEFDELVASKCYYCGRSPSTTRKSRAYNGDFTYNGIDRLENVKGYTRDNVVTCCVVCNRAKREMSVSDFLSWISDLVHYRTEWTPECEF